MTKRRRSTQIRPPAANEGAGPPPLHGTSARGALDRLARPNGRRSTPLRRSRSRLRAWVLPGLLASVVVVAGIFALGGHSSTPAADAVTSPRPILGRTAAPVVVREYGDFQCPTCGAFFRSVEPQLVAAYVDTGKVGLEWHDFAWIGPESRDAANAARCAGDQGRFWQYHDLLYQNQGGENSGAFSKDRLKSLGSSLSLDPAAFGACVDAGSHLGAVQADFSDVLARGFNATPTFLIGSQQIVGAQPFAVFQAAIDAALAQK